MTPLERWWLQEARRCIRNALVKVEYGDWHAAITWVKAVVHAPLVTTNTAEVLDLLASSAAADPRSFISNAAMRAALVRRLEETKTLIGTLLVATADP